MSSSIIDTIKWGLYGNIYNDTYENLGDGGPTCYNEMTNWFRIKLSGTSAIIQLLTIFLLTKRIKKSRECDLSLVKNLNPSWLERITAYISLVTLFVMAAYKIYTGKFIFMLNPCHICLIMQIYLMLTKKTTFSAMVFIQYMRWNFGPWSALVFPNYESYTLPMEIEFFYIEHYLGAFIGPIILILSGRYGFFKQGFVDTIAHQFWGFAFHVLFNRFINLPVSILTWGNINFNLCKPESDPFIPLVGQYYLYFVDHYLNLTSLIFVGWVLVLTGIAYVFLVWPFKLVFGKPQKKETQKVKAT